MPRAAKGTSTRTRTRARSRTPQSIQAETLVMDRHPDDWVAKADNELIGCRAYGHNFPKLQIGTRQKRGVKMEKRAKDGATVIKFVCSDCGMAERTMAITPGGVEESDIDYGYNYDDRYKAPKGTRINRRACRVESVKRYMELAGVK